MYHCHQNDSFLCTFPVVQAWIQVTLGLSHILCQELAQCLQEKSWGINPTIPSFCQINGKTLSFLFCDTQKLYALWKLSIYQNV